MREIVLDPRSLSRRDVASLKRHRARLAEIANAEGCAHGEAAPHLTVRICVGNTEEDVPLPPSLARAVAAALTELADGNALHITSAPEELTTGEAADLLNVSRPFLVKLLEEGVIPYRKVGTHRRLRRADVLAYKEQMYNEAEEALQELADQAQELGLGYE